MDYLPLGKYLLSGHLINIEKIKTWACTVSSPQVINMMCFMQPNVIDHVLGVYI